MTNNAGTAEKDGPREHRYNPAPYCAKCGGPCGMPSVENDAAKRDPYAPLHAHVISVKALYCEDGCGLVETSGYGDDRDAAEELAKSGWVVRPHSMGGLTPLCKDCAARYDAEHTTPIPPEATTSTERGEQHG